MVQLAAAGKTGMKFLAHPGERPHDNRRPLPSAQQKMDSRLRGNGGDKICVLIPRPSARA
jgi:hypothetical protein